MMTLSNLLVISAIIFVIGLLGTLTKKSTVLVIMSLELMFNAAALSFVAFSRFGGMNLDGHIFGLIVIVLAAAEAAVALAIVINIYNNLNTINVDEASTMKE